MCCCYSNLATVDKVNSLHYDAEESNMCLSRHIHTLTALQISLTAEKTWNIFLFLFRLANQGILLPSCGLHVSQHNDRKCYYSFFSLSTHLSALESLFQNSSHSKHISSLHGINCGSFIIALAQNAINDSIKLNSVLTKTTTTKSQQNVLT